MIYLIYKHPEQINLINLIKEINNHQNNLLLRILIEYEFILKQLKTKY